VTRRAVSVWPYAASPHWGVMWAGVALCIGWGTFLTIGGVILAIVGAGFALDYFWRDGLDDIGEKALRAEDLVQAGAYTRPLFDST